MAERLSLIQPNSVQIHYRLCCSSLLFPNKDCLPLPCCKSLSNFPAQHARLRLNFRDANETNGYYAIAHLALGSLALYAWAGMPTSAQSFLAASGSTQRTSATKFTSNGLSCFAWYMFRRLRTTLA